MHKAGELHNERFPKDPRAVLPQMIELIRKHGLSPVSCIRALCLGIRKGFELTRDLVELRQSFAKHLVAHTLLLAMEFLVAWIITNSVKIVWTFCVQVLWFLAASFLAYSQLALVRVRSGKPYTQFGIANSLTFYRFINVPFVLLLIPLMPSVPGLSAFVFFLYVATAVSDLFDGLIARATHKVSEFGRIYDPVTDLIFNAGVAVTFAIIGYIPLWYFILAELRFCLPVFGGTWLYVYRKPWTIQPTFVGKATVASYHCLIGVLFLKALFSYPFLEGLAAKFTVASAILFAFNIMYFIDKGVKKLKNA